MTGRVPYADAGAAMRQAIDRALAAKPPLGPRVWRVLAVVLKFTASYSKLEDRVFLDAVAAEVFGSDAPTRSHRGHVSADLRRLAEVGSIFRQAKPGRPSGATGPMWVVGLPDPETRPPTGALPDEKRAQSQRETRPTLARNAPASGGPTEETSEEEAEGGAHARRNGTSASANGTAPLAAATPPETHQGQTLPRLDDVGPLEWFRARLVARDRIQPGELEVIVNDLRTEWPDVLTDAIRLTEECEADGTSAPQYFKWPRDIPGSFTPLLEGIREDQADERAQEEREARARRKAAANGNGDTPPIPRHVSGCGQRHYRHEPCPAGHEDER